MRKPKENPVVSFSCECGVEVDSLGDKADACKWTCYYESVIGFGKVRFLEKSPEKTEGLDSLMLHNGYKIPAGVKKIAYGMMELTKTMVACIDVEEVSGKRHIKK